MNCASNMNLLSRRHVKRTMTSDNFKHLILETLKVTTIDCMRATIYESKIMHKFLKFVLHLLAKLTMLKLLKTVTHVTRDWWATRATAFQLFTAVPFEFWPFVHFFWFAKKMCAQCAQLCRKCGLLSMQKTDHEESMSFLHCNMLTC